MMQGASKGRLIRADQVAEIVGVSPRVAVDLMRQMPRINIGRSLTNPRWAVYESDVHAWVASRQTLAEMPGQPMRQPRKRSKAMQAGLLDETGHIPRRR